MAGDALFTPLRLGGALELPNRLAVAPMTRVSATAQGHATQVMADYYADFAAGGFGLVITEGIYTDRAHAQGYLFQPGLADAAQRDAWRPVVDQVHAHGGRIVAQLMHAGALSQGNPHRATAKGPSAVQPRGQQMAFYRGEGPYRMPEAMTTADIAEAIDGFAQAARRAQQAGFDGVEIHGANGYLLDQFLTTYTNQRADGYGGSLAKRLRLVVEVIEAVRQSTTAGFAIGVRISQSKVNDFTHQGLLTLFSGSRRSLPACQYRRVTPRVLLHTQGAQRRVARRQGPSLRVARPGGRLRRCPRLQGAHLAAHVRLASSPQAGQRDPRK